MMRRLILLFLTACTCFATVASAVEPVQPPLSIVDSAPPVSPVANDLPPEVINELPDMGAPEATYISHSEERQLGYMIVQELRDQNAIIEDPEISEYVNSVGDRLAAQSPDGAAGFQYFVVKDDGINAFAVPGGFIFINYGLILATENESELASVLGHETAHVTQHHIARAIRAQSQQALPTMAAMLGAILLGALSHGGGGQAIEGGIAAAQGIAVQKQINFTRDEEAEADRVGIGYLAGAGFDTQAMGDFFEVLSRKEGLAATYIPAMLIDHPVTTDRIAEARARAAQFPPRKAKDSLSYALVRERVRVLTAPGDTDIEKYYAARIAQGKNDMATRYGDALALMADNRPVEAQKILFDLTRQHESVIMLHSALGQAEVKAGQTNDALGTFKHAVKLFPRNVPVTVRYAESLVAAGNPKEAHAVLLDLFNNVPPTPEQIRLTANVASAAGDTGDAYYYMGEYQIAGGNLQLAAMQYQLALQSPNLTTIQRQRFQARLDEVREYLATAKLRKTSISGP